MPLETGTYISDLVITNPASTDAKSDGDNHLRLIKSTVKATFPNVTGAVTKTHTQLNNALDKTGDTMTGALNVSGNVLVTGSGGLGYGVGSGGTVTQATSKATGVTLNKPSGQITMNNAALGAGASVIFTLNTTAIAGTADLVIVNTPGATGYRVEALNPFVGTVGIRVTNVSGGSLSDALAINFAVIKGATS